MKKSNLFILYIKTVKPYYHLVNIYSDLGLFRLIDRFGDKVNLCQLNSLAI